MLRSTEALLARTFAREFSAGHHYYGAAVLGGDVGCNSTISIPQKIPAVHRLPEREGCFSKLHSISLAFLSAAACICPGGS
jgi:hypothetical protein